MPSERKRARLQRTGHVAVNHQRRSCEQGREVIRKRRFELQVPATDWMTECEAIRVNRLAWKRDRTQEIGTENIALLADEGVAAQASLEPDLVSLAGPQSHLDERRRLERLDDAVFADGLLAAGIVRMRLLLNERPGVPDQRVAPDPSGGVGCP